MCACAPEHCSFITIKCISHNERGRASRWEMVSLVKRVSHIFHLRSKFLTSLIPAQHSIYTTHKRADVEKNTLLSRNCQLTLISSEHLCSYIARVLHLCALISTTIIYTSCNGFVFVILVLSVVIWEYYEIQMCAPWKTRTFSRRKIQYENLPNLKDNKAA